MIIKIITTKFNWNQSLTVICNINIYFTASFVENLFFWISFAMEITTKLNQKNLILCEYVTCAGFSSNLFLSIGTLVDGLSVIIIDKRFILFQLISINYILLINVYCTFYLCFSLCKQHNAISLQETSLLVQQNSKAPIEVHKQKINNNHVIKFITHTPLFYCSLMISLTNEVPSGTLNIDPVQEKSGWNKSNKMNTRITLESLYSVRVTKQLLQ